jgi:hypothetical protein
MSETTIYEVWWEDSQEAAFYPTLAKAMAAQRESVLRDAAASGQHFNPEKIRPIQKCVVAGKVSRQLACDLLNGERWCASRENIEYRIATPKYEADDE